MRIDQIWVKALRAYDAVKGMIVSELVRRIVVEFVRDRVSYTHEGVAYTLQHLDSLIRTLETQTYPAGSVYQATT